jgi:hypothetical protein
MNRQVNFITNNTKEINGYHNININDLANIINGSITNIVCECLDDLPFETRSKTVVDIINKLAFEGKATFLMINGTVLANRVLKNELDSNKLSSIINEVKSIWTDYYITEVFNNMAHIQIEKYYIENIYTAISINKKL